MGRPFLALACITLAISMCRWVQNKTKNEEDQDVHEEEEIGSISVVQNITMEKLEEIPNRPHSTCPIPGPVPAAPGVEPSAIDERVHEERERRLNAENSVESMRAITEYYRIALKESKEQLSRIAADREEEREQMRAKENQLQAKEQNYRLCSLATRTTGGP